MAFTSDFGADDADEEQFDQDELERLLLEPGNDLKVVHRGDVVEGSVVRIDADELLVDIGQKSEGVLSTRELPSHGYGSLEDLHLGDTLLVYVVQPENQDGHAILSLKRAKMERQWRAAQEQFDRGELIEAEVVDHNKGGLIVNLDGIRGFVPISQIVSFRKDTEDPNDAKDPTARLAQMQGKTIKVKIIELNRARNRLILSERAAVQEWRTRRRDELMAELQVGETRKGVVSNLCSFGAFVDLGGADGLVHVSQLCWSRVQHPSEVLKVGQEVEVKIIAIDHQKKKIALSIKKAQDDPWSQAEKRYNVGDLVNATVTKIAAFGVFARVEDGIEGLVHLSELVEHPGQDPRTVVHEGQELQLRVIRVDTERRRLGLSLRQTGAMPETTPVLTADEAAAAEGEAGAEASAEGEKAAKPRKKRAAKSEDGETEGAEGAEGPEGLEEAVTDLAKEIVADIDAPGIAEDSAEAAVEATADVAADFVAAASEEIAKEKPRRAKADAAAVAEYVSDVAGEVAAEIAAESAFEAASASAEDLVAEAAAEIAAEVVAEASEATGGEGLDAEATAKAEAEIVAELAQSPITEALTDAAIDAVLQSTADAAANIASEATGEAVAEVEAEQIAAEKAEAKPKARSRSKAASETPTPEDAG